jgi:aerobic carbon-monoxide dehydrogenase small subunit
MTLIVDETRHDLDVDSGHTLADVLGEECGVAGYRVAWPDGTCDACAAVVDGDAIRSCLMLAVQADGTRVSTAGAGGSWDTSPAEL